ncbi:uncharacterized protein LOC119087887 isoform X2 [Peromyscus leucopus]|uniref:uncharacterized protein LOC119087887 isoform X2 n=1 Tax=Peromyscus leucopus TaxID=10041 RepID=UPI00188584B0|nr:uncharacterized protein LOC119087887 isoform X2 [Peromyscus leucopus]
MPLCRSRCEARVDSEESAAARGLLGSGDPLVCVDGGSSRVPASGAREGERWASRAAAEEVPSARVRPSRRARATEPVASVRALIGRSPETWALIGQGRVFIRRGSRPLVSKLGGTARWPVKGARKVTLGPWRGRHSETSHPAWRRETIPYCHGPGHWHLSEKPAEDSEGIWREVPFLQVKQPLCASQGLPLLSSTQHSLSSEALLSYKADPIS